MFWRFTCSLGYRACRGQSIRLRTKKLYKLTEKPQQSNEEENDEKEKEGDEEEAEEEKNTPRMTFGTQNDTAPWYSKNTAQNLRNKSEIFDVIRRQRMLVENQASRWRTYMH